MQQARKVRSFTLFDVHDRACSQNAVTTKLLRVRGVRIGARVFVLPILAQLLAPRSRTCDVDFDRDFQILRKIAQCVDKRCRYPIDVVFILIISFLDSDLTL